MSEERFRLLQWTVDALHKAKRKTKPAHPKVVKKLEAQLTELCREWKKDLVAARILTPEGQLVR